jgi:hypothetical protein
MRQDARGTGLPATIGTFAESNVDGRLRGHDGVGVMGAVHRSVAR